VSGPDGNLWFAENQGDIGRITPHGDIIEIKVPTRNAFPMGITAGPDGALWFTERDGNAIGRLDPARVK
jgi:virginiamycin B lyase